MWINLGFGDSIERFDSITVQNTLLSWCTYETSMIDEKKQNVWSGEKEASFLRWILEKDNRCPLNM